MRYTLALAVALALASCGRMETAVLGPGPLVSGPVMAPEEAPRPVERVPRQPVRPLRYRIRTGDVLTISVMGEPDMTETLPVGPDGRISYYVANDLVAAGRTFEELRTEIEERLRSHFKDPKVTAIGKEYKGNTVTVLGQVRNPGGYVVRMDTRLLDVIAMAGGIARSPYGGGAYGVFELANLRGAFLLRGDRFVDADFEGLFSEDEQLVSYNNVYIQAGDRVYIPSAVALENKVMVLGEVVRPMVVRFQRDISVLEAVAEAGGAKESAWERRAFIVRGSLRRPTLLPVNLRELATGGAPDVPLRPGDVVYVPKTALGKAAEIADQIYPLLRSLGTARGLR